jgi:hypothetical protein
MIMSFNRDDNLGFESIDEWTLDIEKLEKDSPQGCKCPLIKKLVRRGPLDVNEAF